ncbi:MAG: metallophosphoesterase [Myxococcales bacterium]|nr:metallophosphoesterase [Myxococcales bacterium]
MRRLGVGVRRRELALVVLLLAGPAAAEPGPVVQVDGPDRARLVFADAAPATMTVRGPGAPIVQFVDAEGRRVAHLSGLKPGAKYVWSAADGSEGRFHTPPPAGRAFTFVAYGDSRTDHRVHAALAERIAAVDPDFVLHTGDLVTRGGHDAEWAAFVEASTPIRKVAALFAVPGNHDLDGGKLPQFRAHFDRPPGPVWQAFTWGNARFLLLDSEEAASGGAPDAEQADWLRDEVGRARRDPAIEHIIAVVHQGPFSSHPERAGNTGLLTLLPELHAAGLSLVISGHDHFYERGEAAFGLPYLVLGAGGAPLYPTLGPGDHGAYRAIVSRTVYSFARLRVRGAELSGCAVDLTGAPFDCFSL